MNKEIFNFLEFFSSGHYCWTLKLQGEKRKKVLFIRRWLATNWLRFVLTQSGVLQLKPSTPLPILLWTALGHGHTSRGWVLTLKPFHTHLQLFWGYGCKGTGSGRGEGFWSEVHAPCMTSLLVACSTPRAIGFLCDCRQVKKTLLPWQQCTLWEQGVALAEATHVILPTCR